MRAQYEAVFAAFPEPTYLTHGNVDRPEQFQDLLRPGVRHLDGESVEVDGLRAGSWAAAPRGSRPHLSEVSHEAFAAKVAALGLVDVLCPHMPPAIDDLCFDVVAGRPEPGSQALLDYVEEHQPDYLYFGHVHQPRRDRLRIGRTWLVNVGYLPPGGCWSIRPDGVLVLFRQRLPWWGTLLDPRQAPGRGRAASDTHAAPDRRVGGLTASRPTPPGIVGGGGVGHAALAPCRRDGARQAEVLLCLGSAAYFGGDVGGTNQITVPLEPAVRTAEVAACGLRDPLLAGGAGGGGTAFVHQPHDDPRQLGLVL